jgi:hypothetical protein
MNPPSFLRNISADSEKLYSSDAGSFLYFGLRSLFGLITLLAFTVPKRSRAIARTSFCALNGFGFLAMRSYLDAISDSATRAASWSNVTRS